MLRRILELCHVKLLSARIGLAARSRRQADLSSTICLINSVGGWLRTLEFWIDRSHQRRQLGELAELNDYLLKDIGVSREEALREAEKPFWR